jgi:hypothetical protein
VGPIDSWHLWNISEELKLEPQVKIKEEGEKEILGVLLLLLFHDRARSSP